MTAFERRHMLQPENNILMYDVPSSLDRKPPFELTLPEEESYRVPVGSIDIGSMLRDVRHRTSRNTIYGIEEMKNSPLREFSEAYSFFDLPNGRKHFTGILGATKFNGSINPEFKDFYEFTNPYHAGNRRLTMDTRGQISNRGGRYYVAKDSRVVTVYDKINSMRQDMYAASSVLEHVDRNTIQDPEKFLQYVGVLDYLKQHSLCLFHTVTYPERFSDFSTNEEYEYVRSLLWGQARSFTRTYYQALCGLPYDDIDAQQLIEDVDYAMQYLVDKNPPINHFKLQEIDHPLIIGLAAYQTVKAFPTVDNLICLPSGGTQFGIATELMYEYVGKMYGNNELPALSSLVISTHAGRRGAGPLLGRDDLVARLSTMDIRGTRVLVLDDNSNTGLTLQIVTDALSVAEARSVSISLAELDPLRIIYKQTSFDPPEFVANLLHSDLRTVASIVPIVAFKDGSDMQLRWVVAESILGKR